MAVLESNARGEAPTNEDRTEEGEDERVAYACRLHGAVLHTEFGQSVAVPPAVVTRAS